MWYLVFGGRKDEKFVHIPNVPWGNICTFRFRGYRLHKKSARIWPILPKKYLGLVSERPFSVKAAKWFLNF